MAEDKIQKSPLLLLAKKDQDPVGRVLVVQVFPSGLVDATVDPATERKTEPFQHKLRMADGAEAEVCHVIPSVL